MKTFDRVYFQNVFNRDYFYLLPDEPNAAIIALCDEFNEFDYLPLAKTDLWAPLYIRFVACLQEKLVAVGEKLPELLPTNNVQDVSIVKNVISEIDEDALARLTQADFDNTVEKLRVGEIVYECEDNDIEAIQNHINDLRDLISASETIEAGHKQRLLKRLEKLQTELNKTMTSLDNVLLVIWDVKVATHQLGESAVPIMNSLTKLVMAISVFKAVCDGVSVDIPFILEDLSNKIGK